MEDLIGTGRKRVAALVGAGLCLSACGPSAGARRLTTPSTASASATSAAPSVTRARATVLRIRRAGWTLPDPLSREVVFAAGGSLEVAGGLLSDGRTSAALTLIDPRTGAARSLGALAVATHDAAGARLHGRRYLFGGGVGSSESTVQRLTSTGSSLLAASMPQARSDLAAAVVRGAAYLLGGYDGTAWAPSILRSTDGSHFRPVARLPVPVRYPAVAVVGNAIWVFGGQSAGGPTAVVQRIDTLTGRVRVVGRLPQPLTDASAVVVDGRILVCGGAVGGRPTSTVQLFDPQTVRFSAVGNLPQPLTDAGSAVVGGVAYLLGGETPKASAGVVTLRYLAPTGGGGS